jgi:glycosyltransferase involved in cell wall biosynthesis
VRALVIANRRPDPLGPADAKIASQAAESLAQRGIDVRIEHAHPTGRLAQASGALRALVTGAPMQLGLTASREFETRVRAVIETGCFDLVVAVHARAARYVPRPHRHRALALMVDAYGLNYATYRNRLPLPLDLAYRSEARRMARLEDGLMHDFGAVAVVSAADAAYLSARSPGAAKVVHLPYAVDLRYFTPRERPGCLMPPVFVFTGRLSFLPNADAATQLITRIWPLLRQRWSGAEMRIVGARPGARLIALARRERVTLLADVPDVRPHIAQATAALVPMRMGGNMQTKVLEAMAMAVPVVCSTFGNPGAAAEDEVLLADTPAEFVHQVERIVGDGDAARRRSAAARRLVETRHSPAIFTERLVNVCTGLGSEKEVP